MPDRSETAASDAATENVRTSAGWRLSLKQLYEQPGLITVAVLLFVLAGGIPALLSVATGANFGHGLLNAVKQAYWRVSSPFYDALWARVEAEKARMPKYKLPAAMNGTMPVHIITIPRLAQRLDVVRARMAEANVSYSLVTGTDGTQPIPGALADAYLGPRLKRLVYEERDAHYIMVAANLLSTLQVYHYMVQQGKPLAVVLEDDACLSPANATWMPRVVSVVEQLPEDWELLYLYAQGGQRGQLVAPNVRVVRKVAGTTCYVISLRGAIKLISLAKGANEGIDKVLFGLEWRHKLQAYVAEPPLCVHGTLPSTLEYNREGQAGVLHIINRRLRALARRALRARTGAVS